MKLYEWLIDNLGSDKTFHVVYKGMYVAGGTAKELYMILSYPLKNEIGFTDDVTFYIE